MCGPAGSGRRRRRGGTRSSRRRIRRGMRTLTAIGLTRCLCATRCTCCRHVCLCLFCDGGFALILIGFGRHRSSSSSRGREERRHHTEEENTTRADMTVGSELRMRITTIFYCYLFSPLVVFFVSLRSRLIASIWVRTFSVDQRADEQEGSRGDK